MSQKHENRATDPAFADILDNDFDKSEYSEIHAQYQPTFARIPLPIANLKYWQVCRAMHPIQARRRLTLDDRTAILDYAHRWIAT